MSLLDGEADTLAQQARTPFLKGQFRTEAGRIGPAPRTDYTARNRAELERGVHPATRMALDHEHTCGTCVHAHRYGNGNKSWIKCDRHRLGMSHSEASDIRAGWPACPLWGAAP